MTLVTDIHEAHSATFETCDGIEVVSHYSHPRRTHYAARGGVSVIEHDYGVVAIEGEDRVGYVDNAMTDTVPDEDGEGVYTSPLNPDGRIETETYVYNAGERPLIFTPRDRAEPFVEEWDSKTFLQRVKMRDASDELGVFDVHGPQSTEKVMSTLSGVDTSEPEFSLVRGSIGDELGVTVVTSDNPTGEEGHDVICHAKDTEDVLDTLPLYGNPSVPMGYRTWDSLTAEADTPLLESELRGSISNVVGVRNALNFDKGCSAGQGLVSKIENRRRPSRRLVSFHASVLPDSGAEVLTDGESVGTITRAVGSPMFDMPIGFALVDYSLDIDALKVAVNDGRVETIHESFPFIEGSAVPAWLSTYPGKN